MVLIRVDMICMRAMIVASLVLLPSPPRRRLVTRWQARSFPLFPLRLPLALGLALARRVGVSGTLCAVCTVFPAEDEGRSEVESFVPCK